MSSLMIQEIILTIMQIVVLVFVIAFSERLIDKSGNRFLTIFFTFSMFSFLLSDIYYIVYDVLRPDTRMPFAADEIADCAAIMLLSSGLETMPENKNRKISGEIIFAVFFMSVNIALWIIWSGEWLQDILFGIPYIYFLYILLRGMNRSRALSVKESYIAIFICTVIIAVQLAAIVAGDPVKELLENVDYIIMYVFSMFFFVKCIRALKDRNGSRKAIYISIVFFLWTILMMFMSGGVFYNISMGMNIVSLPVMFLALKGYNIEEGVIDG